MAQTKCFDCMKWIYRSGPESPLCDRCKWKRKLEKEEGASDDQ